MEKTSCMILEDPVPSQLSFHNFKGADYILEEFPQSPWFEFTCKHYPASHSDKEYVTHQYSLSMWFYLISSNYLSCPTVLRARDGSHLCVEMMGNLNVEALTSGFVPLDEVMRYHIWSMEHNEKLRRDFCKEFGYKELVQAVVIEGKHFFIDLEEK